MACLSLSVELGALSGPILEDDIGEKDQAMQSRYTLLRKISFPRQIETVSQSSKGIDWHIMTVDALEHRDGGTS
jgi:hypothetical protein